MLLVLLLSVAVEIISRYDSPMLFVSVSLCLQETLSFENFLTIVNFIVSESLQRFNGLLDFTIFLCLLLLFALIAALDAELTHAHTEGFLGVDG